NEDGEQCEPEQLGEHVFDMLHEHTFVCQGLGLARSCAQIVSPNQRSHCSGVHPRCPTSSSQRSGWLSDQRMSLAPLTSRPRRRAFFARSDSTITRWLS